MSLRLSEKEFNKYIENKKEKTNKYHNKKIIVDNVKYDSKKEYERHCYLKLLEKAGEISELRFHDKKDTIILQQEPKIKYEPDFCYIENNVFIIEDLKGAQTKDFILKKKMMINKLNNKEIIGKFRLTKYINNKFKIIEEYCS